MSDIAYPIRVRLEDGKLIEIKLTKEQLEKGSKYIADKEKAQKTKSLVDLSDEELTEVMYSGMPNSTLDTQAKAYKNNLKKMMPFFKKKRKLSTYRQVYNWALRYANANERRSCEIKNP